MSEQSIDRFEAYRDVVETRRAVRAHRTDEYGDEVLESVLDVANAAPSAAGAQPWEFVVIRDDDHKEALSRIYSEETKYKKRIDPTFPLAGNSREFVRTPATVLVVGDRRYEAWWPRLPDGTRRKLHQQSMASAIMTLHLAGVTAGLGTAWVTTRGPTQGKIRDLLDLPEWYKIGSAAPLGYPNLEEVPLVKSRHRPEEKLHRETIDPDDVPEYDDVMARKEGAREDVYRPDVGDVDPEERWRTALDPADFGEIVRATRPVYEYQDDPVDVATIEGLVGTAIWAPSGANSQPWEYVVIEDAERQAAVVDAVREDRAYKRQVDPGYNLDDPSPLVNVPPAAFESAPAILVAMGNRHLEKLWPQVPDGSREKLFRHSVGASITAFGYAAATAGVGTAWLTPTSLGNRRILDLVDAPPWFEVESVTPLGLPADEGERTPGRDLDETLHVDGIDPDRIPSAERIQATAPRYD